MERHSINDVRSRIGCQQSIGIRPAPRLLSVGELRWLFLFRCALPQCCWFAYQADVPSAKGSKVQRLVPDLSTVLKIATHIGAIRDEGGLQWQLSGMLFDIVRAQRSAILFFGAAGETARSAAWDRVHGPEVPVRVSRTLLKKTITERTGLLLDNIKRSSLGQADSLQAARVRSALSVPLMLRDRVSGVIYLDTRSPENPFDSDHLQLITAIAGLMSLAWENVRHLDKLREENKCLHEEINLKSRVGGRKPSHARGL